MAGYTVNFTYLLSVSVLNVLFITLEGSADTVHAHIFLNPALQIGEW
jgi:hypothetical protein